MHASYILLYVYRYCHDINIQPMKTRKHAELYNQSNEYLYVQSVVIFEQLAGAVLYCV